MNTNQTNEIRPALVFTGGLSEQKVISWVAVMVTVIVYLVYATLDYFVRVDVANSNLHGASLPDSWLWSAASTFWVPLLFFISLYIGLTTLANHIVRVSHSRARQRFFNQLNGYSHDRLREFVLSLSIDAKTRQAIVEYMNSAHQNGNPL